MFAHALAGLLFVEALPHALSHAPFVSRATEPHLIKFGPNANDTAWFTPAALERLHDALHDGARASLTSLSAEPAFAGVDPRALTALTGERFGCGPGYIDLTDATLPAVNDPAGTPPLELNFASVDDDVTTFATFPTPSPAAYPELTSMFAKVSGTGLNDIVRILSTNFTTRYYRSTIARQSALWIQDRFTSIVGADNVALVENSFDQPNVIGAIPAATGSTATDIVVIGAHLDSINQRSATGVAPGADDDASGIAVITQALEILKASGFRGKRRIEAHAYGGEEGGLLGSARTASQYKSAGKTVRAMLQLDMIGYQPATAPIIVMLNDTAVDAGLRTFIRAILAAYVPEATVSNAQCNYACSDHYSFINQGWPGGSINEAGPSGGGLNPYYHTANDTIDKLNLEKASVFVKAVLAFAVEASERATTLDETATEDISTAPEDTATPTGDATEIPTDTPAESETATGDETEEQSPTATDELPWPFPKQTDGQIDSPVIAIPEVPVEEA